MFGLGASCGRFGSQMTPKVDPQALWYENVAGTHSVHKSYTVSLGNRKWFPNLLVAARLLVLTFKTNLSGGGSTNNLKMTMGNASNK